MYVNDYDSGESKDDSEEVKLLKVRQFFLYSRNELTWIIPSGMSKISTLTQSW